MVDQLEALVENPPSLVYCASLTVTGEVKFGDKVSFHENVTVVNK